MKIFYNNNLIEEDELIISPHSKGFQFGKGIFSTLKIVGGKIFFLRDHLLRISHSLKKLFGVNIEFNDNQFLSKIETLLSVNLLENARLKIIFFEDTIGFSTIIKLSKLVINKEPVRLKLSQEKRGDNVLYKHKTLNYLQNILQKENAEKKGFYDFLYQDYNGNILETSYCNIFFVKGNQILTPFKELNLLPGIIRNRILHNQNLKDFQLIESKICSNNIEQFDSCFLTNSIHGCVGIESINDCHFSEIGQNLFDKLSIY